MLKVVSKFCDFCCTHFLFHINGRCWNLIFFKQSIVHNYNVNIDSANVAIRLPYY